MSRLKELKSHLKRGTVYRRKHLDQWSKSVDRDLKVLINDGTLQKVASGMYYYPSLSTFGPTPAKEEELIKKYLDDSRFLLISPNLYNRLGVGTTQLYNTRIVYNNKRHGEVMFGNRKFSFQRKPRFPSKITTEFLAVDLVNNLDKLAEDSDLILEKLAGKLASLNMKSLKQSISSYGSVNAKRIFASLLRETDYEHGHRLSS